MDDVFICFKTSWEDGPEMLRVTGTLELAKSEIELWHVEDYPEPLFWENDYNTAELEDGSDIRYWIETAKVVRSNEVISA